MRRNRKRNEYQKKSIQKKPMVCLGDSRKVEEGKEQQINCAHKHDKIINDSQNVYNREKKKPLNSNRLLVIFHWNQHFFLTYIQLFIHLTASLRIHCYETYAHIWRTQRADHVSTIFCLLYTPFNSILSWSTVSGHVFYLLQLHNTINSNDRKLISIECFHIAINSNLDMIKPASIVSTSESQQIIQIPCDGGNFNNCKRSNVMKPIEYYANEFLGNIM